MTADGNMCRGHWNGHQGEWRLGEHGLALGQSAPARKLRGEEELSRFFVHLVAGSVDQQPAKDLLGFVRLCDLRNREGEMLRSIRDWLASADRLDASVRGLHGATFRAWPLRR